MKVQKQKAPNLSKKEINMLWYGSDNKNGTKGKKENGSTETASSRSSSKSGSLYAIGEDGGGG